MFSRKHLLIALGIALLLCAINTWFFFGVQTVLTMEARHIARKMPVVYQVPVELSDLSISQAKGRRLSYCGYEFEVPWHDIDESKSRIISGEKATVAFRSGNVLFMWCSPPNEFVNTFLSSGKIDAAKLREIYGDEPLRSDYAFHRVILQTTPDTISSMAPTCDHRFLVTP